MPDSQEIDTFPLHFSYKPLLLNAWTWQTETNHVLLLALLSWMALEGKILHFCLWNKNDLIIMCQAQKDEKDSGPRTPDARKAESIVHTVLAI